MAKSRNPYMPEDVAIQRALLEQQLRDKQQQWYSVHLAIEAAGRVLRKAQLKKLRAVAFNTGVNEQVEPQIKAQSAQLTQQQEELEDFIEVLQEQLAALPRDGDTAEEAV